MQRRGLILAAGLLVWTGNAAIGADYVPGTTSEWVRKTPREAGLDPAKLRAAVDFAVANETEYKDARAGEIDVRDLRLKTALDRAHEPFSDPVGPFKRRAAANGIILRHGYIVAEWGQTDEVDMTFSVSKTFLSHVAGLAYDRKMIRDVNTPVRKDAAAEYFTTKHNAPITWDQMLRQTSGWSGTLFDKPDWADRPGKKGDPAWADLLAGPKPPGKHWEYNDVRVNMLALALLHLWQRPLPEVLKELVMDPIGASDGWHWEGYSSSWVEMDGKRVQSVAGGGHWGGGMFISAFDLARLGLLGLRRGQWGEKHILSEDWFSRCLTPTDQNAGYGYMNFFLNAEGAGRPAPFPAAPKTAFAYFGAGTNMVYIDPDHDIVAVVRWMDNEAVAEFVKLLLGAVEE